ncbi:CHAD domain-containing protein [Streptomyces diastatochromogenes]|nr:CHAD domain-containing protein [Streptomyces diastatochromogenes]
MRPELAWLSGTLGLEHAYESRLERLLLALHRLSGSTSLPAQAVITDLAAGGRPASPTPTPERGNLTVGAAKAGALLERQLTLARTRAHSTALQALGSSRFHAVADKVAVLASEVPLTPTAPTTDLRPSRPPPRSASQTPSPPSRCSPRATPTTRRPWSTACPRTRPAPQDGPWHQVRLLLRLHRYAREVLYAGSAPWTYACWRRARP